MNTFENVKLEKTMYQGGEDFYSALEKADPKESYAGTELAQLTAFERQLKRFDIKVSGKRSDSVEKFFKTSDSALLFPAYMAKAVTQGMDGKEILDRIIATKTDINSMDYRSITSLPTTDEKELKAVLEGGFIPETTIALKENLVSLKKRGRMLKASYEAIRFQRLDLFSVALKQIGSHIAKSQLKDAVDVLINGDGNANPAEKTQTAASGVITYADLAGIWAKFEDYEMNTLLVSPDMANKILSLNEFRNMGDGNRFTAPNSFATPFGAVLIKSGSVPAGTVIALDKSCAIEMVTAGGVNVDYDKLIDCQMERVAITSIGGFAKIFPEAVKVLTLKA